MLLTTDGTVKLADFGLARKVDAVTTSRGAAGTLGYMSPEAIDGSRTLAADIWALGIVATQLASNQPPVEIVRTAEQVDALLARIPAAYSRPFHEAIARTLRLVARERPTTAQLRATPPFAPPPTAANSVQGLAHFVERALWMAPLRVDGLLWTQMLTEGGAAHVVRLCEVETDAPPPAGAPQEASAALLADLVAGVPGNDAFSSAYRVAKTTLCHCRARENQFAAKVLELNMQLADTALFSLEAHMARGTAEQRSARRAVLDRFMRTYPSLAEGAPNVRVWLAFHAAPSEAVAKSVCGGGFAVLSQLDAGFFGQGIYLTLDAEYCISEYGVNVYQQTVVPLLVCAVVIGNAFPVVEMPCVPTPPDGAPADAPTGGYLGSAIVGKAHAHLAVVAKRRDPHDPVGEEYFYPCAPAEWSARRTYTELVVRDASQVLPLGYLMVAPQHLAPAPAPVPASSSV